MSSIDFHLDARSGLSYNLQLIQQVRQAVRFGRLRPGDQLPTVREVVAQVPVNPNTVLKAYSDLEHAGLVVTRVGVGTFVAEGIAPPVPEPAYALLRREFKNWVASARREGLDDRTISDLIDDTLRSERGEGVA
jgi:GntR family transcriptional regulator